MTSPINVYEIRLYNRVGALQQILTGWSRFEYHQRINGAWNHQLTIEYGEDNPKLDQLREIEDDWFVLAYRTDPVTEITTRVYEGFHITPVDQTRSDGSVVFNSYGSGYTTLLSRRVIVPPAGQTHDVRSGSAE